MNKSLLSVILGAACMAPAANAAITGSFVFPEGLEIDQPTAIKVSVNNDGRAVKAGTYTMQLIRTFTSVAPNGLEWKDYLTEVLVDVSETPEIPAGESEIEIPYTFEVGGSFDLLLKITPNAGQVTEIASEEPLVVSVPKSERPIYDRYMPSEELASPFWTSNFSTAFNGMYKKGAQTIYSTTLTDMPRDCEIYSITYFYQPTEYNTNNLRYKIYMGMVDSNVDVFDSASPLNQETVLVYDNMCPLWEKRAAGENEQTDRPIVFELGRPFHYDASKNLVITIVCEPGQEFKTNGFVWMRCEKQFVTADGSETPEDKRVNLYAAWYEEGDFFSSATSGRRYRDNLMPKVKLSYSLDKEAEKIDLGLGEVTLPTNVTVGEQASFRVDVTNYGTVSVDDFTLELLDVTEGVENAQVLASQAVDDTLGPDGEVRGRVRYTFENEGEYKLALRVVVDGDINADNDMTDVFDLHVGPQVGVQTVEVGTVLSYAAGVIRVGLEDAVSLQVSAADGRVVLASALEGESEVAAALPMGVYVARVADKAGKSYIAKFIVK